MVDRSYFTPKMNEMVDVAGLSEDAVHLLVRNRGGTRVTIPMSAPAGHWLERLIGGANANQLCNYYAGEEVDIPLGPFTTAAQRREHIRRLDRSDLSYGEIALRVGCDRRTVIRQVKGTSNRPKNTEQPDFFADHHPRPRKKKPA